MTSLKQVYARFIQDIFPPKFVFCATPEGEIRTIYLSELESLENKVSIQGVCYDSSAHQHLDGNFPIIQLTCN